MTDKSDNRQAQPLADRKARDRAFILPVVGLALLLPPIGSIFQLDFRVAGIPFTALYLFGVWALLIAGAAQLSRRLRNDPESVGESTPPREPPE